MLRPRLFAALLLVGCAHVGSPHGTTPLALEPVDGATLESKRPHFTWTLPDGADGALVEICRDRTCAHVEDTIVGREAGEPTHDLPSVPLFYRVVATKGGVRGATTPMRAFELHVTTTLHGRHADLTVPYDTEALGQSLVELSDHAFERYAEWLGAASPQGRCSIELLLPVEYGRAGERNRSALHYSTAGFTRAGVHDHTEAYVRFDLGSARSTEALPGNVEQVTLHELAHCVTRLVKHGWADDFPAWWTEGAAELFAERALAESFSITPGRVVVTAARVQKARRLVKSGWLPLTRLFDMDLEALHTSDDKGASVVYSEGGALLHFLDTSPRYHDRFASFLHYLTTVHAFFISRRLRSNFEELVGPLDAIDTDFRAGLFTDDVLRFRASSGELRPFHSAGIALDGVPGCLALEVGADGNEAQAHAGESLSVVLTPRAGDAKDVQIVFGDKGKHRYQLWLTEGDLPLVQLRSPGRTKVEATAAVKVKAGALSPGAITKIRVALGVTSVDVTLDDEPIFSGRLPVGATNGGWGLGARYGPVHARSIERAP